MQTTAEKTVNGKREGKNHSTAPQLFKKVFPQAAGQRSAQRSIHSPNGCGTQPPRGAAGQMTITGLIEKIERQEEERSRECIEDALQQSTNDIRLYNSGMRYMEKLSEFAMYLKERILGVDAMSGNGLKNLPGRIARNRLVEIFDEDDGKAKRYLAFDIIRCDKADGYVCLYALDKHDNKLYKTTFRIIQLYDMLQKKQMKFLCN